MIDKLIITVMILITIIATHYATYELGKKYQCERDADYIYSLDMGVCLKVGYENIYGQSK